MSHTSVAIIPPAQKEESYVPTKRQKLAHLSDAKYILYGGAMGGGKSCWLVNTAIDQCQRYPGIVGHLFRHERMEFMKTTYVELEKWLPTSLVASHNHQLGKIVFTNKSVLYYGGLGDDQRAITRLKSLQLGFYGIDQIEETTEDHFYMLATRLRLPPIPGVKFKFKGYSTANPMDNWVKIRWIKQDLKKHDFIQALPSDNPYLPEDYEDEQFDLLPEELAEAWMRGNWDVISDANVIFPYKQVLEAMLRESKTMEKVTAMGVDVAWEGNDESVFAFKKGNKFWYKVYFGLSPMEVADKAVEFMFAYPDTDVFIDAIGLGAGTFDRVDKLKKAGKIPGHIGRVYPYIASAASGDRRFLNKRAEDHIRFQSILSVVDLPNDDKLAKQMTIRYRVRTSDKKLRVESKEEFKKRIKMSPDRLDAVVMANSKPPALRPGRIGRRK